LLPMRMSASTGVLIRREHFKGLRRKCKTAENTAIETALRGKIVTDYFNPQHHQHIDLVDGMSDAATSLFVAQARSKPVTEGTNFNVADMIASVYVVHQRKNPASQQLQAFDYALMCNPPKILRLRTSGQLLPYEGLDALRYIREQVWHLYMHVSGDEQAYIAATHLWCDDILKKVDTMSYQRTIHMSRESLAKKELTASVPSSPVQSRPSGPVRSESLKFFDRFRRNRHPDQPPPLSTPNPFTSRRSSEPTTKEKESAPRVSTV